VDTFARKSLLKVWVQVPNSEIKAVSQQRTSKLSTDIAKSDKSNLHTAPHM